MGYEISMHRGQPPSPATEVAAVSHYSLMVTLIFEHQVFFHPHLCPAYCLVTHTGSKGLREVKVGLPPCSTGAHFPDLPWRTLLFLFKTNWGKCQEKKHVDACVHFSDGGSGFASFPPAVSDQPKLVVLCSEC